MKILITGSSGFVGKHLIDRIKNSHELLIPSSDELNCLNHSKIIDYIALHKPDAVVNLAAVCGGIGINKDNPAEFGTSNLLIGTYVLDACLPTKSLYTPRLINLGSVCSYPKHAEVPFREDDLWDGYPEETNAPYGIAKKTVMMLGAAHNEQYGTEVINLIPVNLAGEHDNFDLYSSHVIPAMIRKFEESDDVVDLWGDGSASREFLYAGDLAEAIEICLDCDYPGPEPINIGTGYEITIKNLAEKIKSIGEYFSTIAWDESKPNGQPRRCLNIQRAKSRLGWTPSTTLDELLKKTIRWYRDQT